MSEAGRRLIEGAFEMLAVAKGERPAASITMRGHRYVSEVARSWADIDTAPRDRCVLLLLGETIPEVPDVRVGSWIGEGDAAELGERLSASGGWMIWNSADDWFTLPFHAALGWIDIPGE